MTGFQVMKIHAGLLNQRLLCSNEIVWENKCILVLLLHLQSPPPSLIYFFVPHATLDSVVAVATHSPEAPSAACWIRVRMEAPAINASVQGCAGGPRGPPRVGPVREQTPGPSMTSGQAVYLRAAGSAPDCFLVSSVLKAQTCDLSLVK